MSGGLDDSPLPVPYPSPKHQKMGSPRHQVLASQQPALQTTSQKVATNQQEGPNAMSRQQKTPAADGDAPVPATVVRQAGDTKPLSQSTSTPTTTKSVSEAQRKEKTMPKLISEPPSVTEETKPTYKKGTAEPTVTTTTKDDKRDSQRSRYYEVLVHFRALFNGAKFSEFSNLKTGRGKRSSFVSTCKTFMRSCKIFWGFLKTFVRSHKTLQFLILVIVYQGQFCKQQQKKPHNLEVCTSFKRYYKGFIHCQHFLYSEGHGGDGANPRLHRESIKPNKYMFTKN